MYQILSCRIVSPSVPFCSLFLCLLHSHNMPYSRTLLIGAPIVETNYTSIDPKQFQNDSLGPMLIKIDFLVRPTFPPKSKLLYHLSTFINDFCRHHRARPQSSGRGQSMCPGLVSAARGQEKEKRRTTAGQEEDKTRPQSPATKSSGARPVSVASSFF